MAMIRPRTFLAPAPAPSDAPPPSLGPSAGEPPTLSSQPVPAPSDVPAAPASDREPNLRPGDVVGTMSATGGTAEVAGEPEQPATVQELLGSYDSRADAFTAARRIGLERGTTASVISKDGVYSAVLLDEDAGRGFPGRHITPADGVQVEGHARDGKVHGPAGRRPLPLPDRPTLPGPPEAERPEVTPPAGAPCPCADPVSASYTAHRDSWRSYAALQLTA